jgi:hypothetical protein
VRTIGVLDSAYAAGANSCSGWDALRRWNAPKSSRTDDASIPRFLWAVVGSTYTGDYRPVG